MAVTVNARKAAFEPCKRRRLASLRMSSQLPPRHHSVCSSGPAASAQFVYGKDLNANVFDRRDDELPLIDLPQRLLRWSATRTGKLGPLRRIG